MWSSIDRHFEPIVEAPGQARAFLYDAFEAQRGDAIDAAVLLTSELATNAVLHAGTPFVISLSWHDPTLHVEVSDTSVEPAHLREPGNGAKAEGGHGLRILAAFADAWGARPSAEGKTVWFDLSFDRYSQPARAWMTLPIAEKSSRP
jgi:hypothetical protein